VISKVFILTFIHIIFKKSFFEFNILFREVKPYQYLVSCRIFAKQCLQNLYNKDVKELVQESLVKSTDETMQFCILGMYL